ncbi:MAG: glycosyltransferase family 39 protein [Acidobacteriota bacterium]
MTKLALATSGSGWGMGKIVGGIYFIVGRNILAAQSFCGVLGAATVPMIYSCARKIFNNRRVGQISALLVALYPAFIVWTGQLLKDGLIIFLLVLAMTMVLLLQEKFRYTYVFLLTFSLLGIISLRFYIFYMVALAIVGAFIVGTSNSPQSIMRRVGALVIIGIGLTYFGVIKNAGSEIDEFANLDRIERSRSNLARSADSGFGENLDVSTIGGALAALPIGFTYLMFAPFPWEMSNFRQAIALPEVLVWWASIPFLIGGLIYTIRHRLRKAIPVLIFSLMLTIAYSLFQGNVGTAYRQRTQIQVFLFMFIAVSWTMREEKQENRRLLKQIKRNQFANRSGIGGVEGLPVERTDK